MVILFEDGTPGHNPRELYLKPTGGTLTSLTKVPEYLAKRGHAVYVQSEYKKNDIVNGVNYVEPGKAIPKWDVVVFNRNLVNKDFIEYGKKFGAKSIWWIHDLVDERQFTADDYKYVDKIVGMSQYSIDTYSDYFEIPKAKFELISNGVDSGVFYSGSYEKRNPNLYIVASAAHRGFDTLETVYWALKKKNPALEMVVYSSQKLHHTSNSAEQDKSLRRLKEIGVRVLEPVNQADLAEVMRKAWVLLMPYKIPETCCNLLLQARACGLPVVSSNIGANREWITHERTGLLTQWPPHDYFNWLKDAATQAIRLYADKDLHARISEQGMMDVPTWQLIGYKWEKMLEGMK